MSICTWHSVPLLEKEALPIPSSVFPSSLEGWAGHSSSTGDLSSCLSTENWTVALSPGTWFPDKSSEGIEQYLHNNQLAQCSHPHRVQGSLGYRP